MGSGSTHSRSRQLRNFLRLPWDCHPPRFPRLSWHRSPDLDGGPPGIASHQHSTSSSLSSSTTHRSWADPHSLLHLPGSTTWSPKLLLAGGLGTLSWGYYRLAAGLALTGSPSASDGAEAPLPILASPWLAAAWRDMPSPAGACPSHSRTAKLSQHAPHRPPPAPGL